MIMAKKKKIKLLFSPTRPAALNMSVDKEKIYQVFYNLIDNAIKYSKERGVVKIGCKENNNEIIIYIKDSGLGIPQKQQKRVFQKFFRADNVMSSETSGSGLGLYIVKAIVEAHDGEIWFESAKNKGTTFFVSLPKYAVQKKGRETKKLLAATY